MVTITFCQCIYGEREYESRLCVERVRPYVNRIVLIHDNTLSQPFLNWLYEQNCELYHVPWTDDFPAYRNEYLKRVKTDWVAVSDPDELYSKSFVEALRGILETSQNGTRFNALKVNAHDIDLTPDKPVEERKSSHYKMLVFKHTPDVKYVGIGRGRVHEELVGLKWRFFQLPDEYYYTHTKKAEDVWLRAFRNFHIGGGGNNLGDKNPIWPQYRELLKLIRVELLQWPIMRDYIRRGNIDQRLKDFLIEHRNRNVITDADEELRNAFKYYFQILHPDENAGNWISNPEAVVEGSDQDVRMWVEKCYLDVLGRHADEGGKTNYINQIKMGQIRKGDLPTILGQSDEAQALRDSKLLARELVK